MIDDASNLAEPTKPAAGRVVLGGVSTVVALALAVSAVLGAISIGVVSAERATDGMVSRYAVAAIVRYVERSRVRDEDVPAGKDEHGPGRGVLGSCFSVPIAAMGAWGWVNLDRLTLGLINTPPPPLA